MSTRNFKFLIVLLCLASCQQTPKNLNDAVLKKKTLFSENERSEVRTNAFDLDTVVVIDEWLLHENQLICKSRKNKFFFYHFNIKDFSYNKAWGSKGEGPDEFIAPHLLPLSSTSCLVIDNGKREVVCLDNGGVVKKMLMPTKVVSSPLMYKYPLIGYVEKSPHKIVWQIQNIETLERIDSLSFIDDTRQGNSFLYDFCWDIHENILLLASLYEDRFMMAEIQNGRIVNKVLYYGDGLADENTPCYSDVQCTKEYIYLLSQKEVDIRKGEGFSVVEIYDYNGNPKMLLELDIIARRMLVDTENERLLFHSPMDDEIHVLDWKVRL